jgi:hypothetical protein
MKIQGKITQKFLPCKMLRKIGISFLNSFSLKKFRGKIRGKICGKSLIAVKIVRKITQHTSRPKISMVVISNPARVGGGSFIKICLFHSSHDKDLDFAGIVRGHGEGGPLRVQELGPDQERVRDGPRIAVVENLADGGELPNLKKLKIKNSKQQPHLIFVQNC